MSEPHNNPIESMAGFFDSRAGDYDQHMAENVDSFADLYEAVARPFTPTTDPVRILDLGCGTGLELPLILARVPRATVTGVDLSAGMLAQLRARFAASASSPTLHLIQASYLDLPLGEAMYDYAVSVMTLHHLLPDAKRALYHKIWRALRPGGRYVEGEWIVSREAEARYLAQYREQANALGEDPAGRYHLDIPFSLPTQQRLLRQAGFPTVDVVWQGEGAAVYEAVKAE